MIYGSVCSGVEAATVAWHPLGWKPAWFCEFEKFPSAVLKHHYPDVPNLHDMTEILENEVFNDKSINVLVGGTPCQSFSIAGLRKGLDDERGNLALQFCKILERKKPRWFIWENVPGVLSSNEGRDFGNILGAMGQCGYGFAYRVLDAQYFGVAQRRRRVFVVGYLGDWRPAAAVLFEQESLRGDITKIKKEGENPTESIGKCLTARGAGGGNHDPETANFAINGNIIDRTEISGGNGLGITSDGLLPTLRTSDIHAVCYSFDSLASNSMKSQNPYSGCKITTKSKTIDTTNSCPSKNQGGIGVLYNKIIRRLTPIECERLQGFPDNYTNIPWRAKDYSPDGPRYKAMGNSMAVPVMKWIGERIQMFEDINLERNLT